MASASHKLREYRRKRRLDRSGEPAGGDGGDAAGDGGEAARFVVQQHDARTRHWDLRLEAGGVLKSWAVPKGPSTDPRQRRLAVATEDHPLDYADFEGVIPDGEYGAGTVIVWDAGTYRNLTTDDAGAEIPVEDAVAAGHVAVSLAGHKLSGGYALTRMGAERSEWLLVKMADEAADARRNPVSTQPESVLSGRTVAEVSAASSASGTDEPET